ncbi:MAG TPA: glycoside-pentoside-hexuronide (GPH):cation symporter [Candidatus Eubacterium faecale]|jgi:GPH family glycoside/pentoside/hexuronide:cation symporter|uniref:Glycoside-pentoside-hexuronide (GPH):cation symporter n=1 Tax=Candidatus Eubacterium faecale TaxID=2838568 RepID=A0A9D2MH68_9FIRM|nr:glycoside-pentoside-hexuronide (GPH):cation symporter [Candidatus Eubacterium faecale]
MKEKAVKPFGIKDKLGYMFGDFGNDFTFLLSSTFLLKFYTDVMAVDAYVVGIVMMVARIVDAFTDIGMGRICDRSKDTKNGKFKPWILRMCGPVAIFSFLMYQSALSDIPYAAKIAYLFVTYILWGSVFYTAVNIPYGSMASAISPDPGDRQSLSTFRTMGGALAGAVVTAGIPLIAYDKINGNDILNGPRFTIIAGACSVFAIICYLLCYNMCTERVKVTVTAEQLKRNSVGVMFVNAFKNRALISLIVASILMLIAQLTLQQMANYVFPNYYGNAKAQTLSMVMMGVGMVVAAFSAKPLANRFGKAEIGAVSNFAAGILCIVLYFVRPQNVFVYAAFQMVSWIGLGVFQIVAWALVTDVIDYSEIKNGIREDGAVYGMYSFARKLGQAATSGLVGGLLTLVGYEQGTAFDPAVKEGIFDIATLVPAVGFLLLAVVLWFWYPLHKKQVDHVVSVLKEKHQNDSPETQQ